MKQATFRLRTETPGALIDEYTDKVQRLRGEDGKSALALALAQKFGEKQFWRYQQHLAQTADREVPGQAPMTNSAPGATPPRPPSPAAAPKPGSGAVTAGAYMMGIGAVDFGLGSLIVSSTSGALGAIALVGGITVGALLVAIGFIVLIVGALMELGSP
jgi:hypothetical protein